MKNLTAIELSKMLTDLHACREASEWAQGKDLGEIWSTCHRGDWMLWLLGRMVDREGWLNRKELCVIICDVVQPSLRHVRAGELRPRTCVDTVRGWIAGTHTIEQVREARRAASAAAASAAYAASAYAASAAAYAAADAADAAYAAASAAASAADAASADAAADASAAYAADAAVYAACAADASASADAASAYSSTRNRSLLESADICRGRVSIDCSDSEVRA